MQLLILYSVNGSIVVTAFSQRGQLFLPYFLHVMVELESFQIRRWYQKLCVF